MGSTVRIISPGMLSTVERQNQSQAQQLLQQTQQVTNMPATYHVPRGPAAVANISAPRSTVATPIVRANTGQAIPTTRPGYILFIWSIYLYVPEKKILKTGHFWISL